MADQNQFNQILDLLLSIDNDGRVAAEVGGHIMELYIFLWNKLSDTFVVQLCHNTTFLVVATCSVRCRHVFEFARFVNKM